MKRAKDEDNNGNASGDGESYKSASFVLLENRPDARVLKAPEF